ncbi:uncharacterized protein LOC123385159 [Felis catus]|uniref:uncharacterized protein LOC123385159 n=1 Tax=Felis catus TaxID=9685 RepID=UPI001D1A04E0|nr:uncharacterized protein LOC123385159 [Felis catus]
MGMDGKEVLQDQGLKGRIRYRHSFKLSAFEDEIKDFFRKASEKEIECVKEKHYGGFARGGVVTDGPGLSPHASFPLRPPQQPQTPTRSAVPRAIPCSAGKAFTNPKPFRWPAPAVWAPPGRGAVPRAPFPAGARTRAPGARRRPAVQGETGRGGGAGPSARGAGGARDHAARGRARSAARWRRRGEQWRPRPPEGRVRCWCCCGGCRCCGAAAGWVASAARAGPPVAVQSLCQPRSQAGTQAFLRWFSWSCNRHFLQSSVVVRLDLLTLRIRQYCRMAL